ncbi:MAG TPA: RDD family protein [Candidatus Acidoferrales bacterium]|nr:RDD family protein [Candidatus Acidoferrales bacterium]
MICASCGATAKEGAAFCGSCGKPIIGYSVGQTSAGAGAGGAYVAAGGAAPGDTGRYAGFWLRVVAAIIDGLVLGIPFGILIFLTIASAIPALVRYGNQPPNPMVIVMAVLPRIFFILVLVLAASWLYWAAMESSEWQATLGKKALGLYVTDLSGSRVSFGKASGRFFAGRGISFVPSIGGLYWLVDCIMAGFTEKKQALHDMIAGCLVQRNA